MLFCSKIYNTVRAQHEVFASLRIYIPFSSRIPQLSPFYEPTSTALIFEQLDDIPTTHSLQHHNVQYNVSLHGCSSRNMLNPCSQRGLTNTDKLRDNHRNHRIDMPHAHTSLHPTRLHRAEHHHSRVRMRQHLQHYELRNYLSARLCDSV